MTYDSNHNVTQLTNENGKIWDMTYDSLGNLLTLTHPSVGGAPRACISYNYDPGIRCITFTNELGKVWKYEYDPNGNLTTEQDPVQAVALPPTNTRHQYDARGLRTKTINALNKETTFAYTLNPADLISVTDPLMNTITYGYDSYGRRTRVTLPDPPPSGATTTFGERIVEVHQVGRTLKTKPKVPVSRERAALRDVRRSPELRGARRIFHQY